MQTQQAIKVAIGHFVDDSAPVLADGNEVGTVTRERIETGLIISYRVELSCGSDAAFPTFDAARSFTMREVRAEYTDNGEGL